MKRYYVKASHFYASTSLYLKTTYKFHCIKIYAVPNSVTLNYHLLSNLI